jgi:hypothetical protein
MEPIQVSKPKIEAIKPLQKQKITIKHPIAKII